MKVSVVIPTCRRPAELERCLASLQRQTCPDFEVVIVNDSGAGYPRQDEVRSIVAGHEDTLDVSYIENERSLGGARSRNLGFATTKGEFICLLDDDDEFEPEKTSKQLAYLAKHPEYAAVYCGYRVYRGRRLIGVKLPKDCGDLRLKILLMDNPVAAGSTLMIRAETLHELGGFDEQFLRHQDWEFMMRFFAGHRIGVVPEPLVRINLDDSGHRSNEVHVETAKQQFLDKFQAEIESFGDPLASEIYHRHYFWLARFFVYNRNPAKAAAYLRLSAEHRKLKLKDYLELIAYVVDSRINYIPFAKSVLLRFSRRGQVISR